MDWTPDNIRALRLHFGETQEQFASRLGLDRRQTVHDWESGKRNPSGTARKLLDILAATNGFAANGALKHS